MTAGPLRIVGVVGSPYSRKLRAVLRYRRIPHAWIHAGHPEARALPRPKVTLLPQLIWPADDGSFEARTDTTPLIRDLERAFPNERTVIPPDPAIAFLDALVEDYADEWLTKAMFHYRWAHSRDAAKAATILPLWSDPGQSDPDREGAGRSFAQRQVGRLGVVGSNDSTRAVIEDSYVRFLAVYDRLLRRSDGPGSGRFLLGGRPAASDFAIYGQLTQLALFDPTPAALALDRAPRVVAHVDLVEDLSGLEPEAGDWNTRATLPDYLRPLLLEIGRVYSPFLLANEHALANDLERVECEIDGRAWTQVPFRYQRKCLDWLRRDYARLDVTDRSWLTSCLEDTRLLDLFA